MLPLSTLLFGQPLTQREDEQAITHLGWSLDRVLKGVLNLLQHDTGDTEAYRQARREWEVVLASDYDYAGIAARRAALPELFCAPGELLHELAPLTAACTTLAASVSRVADRFSAATSRCAASASTLRRFRPNTSGL